jgi:hypothetical protein
MSAELLMLLSGISAFVLTVYWVRSRKLREKYAIGWLLVASLGLLCGLFPNVVMGLAQAWNVGYLTIVVLFVLMAIYAFTFFVSVALSGLGQRGLRLIQEVALLEYRINALEQRLAALTQQEEQSWPKAADIVLMKIPRTNLSLDSVEDALKGGKAA